MMFTQVTQIPIQLLNALLVRLGAFALEAFVELCVWYGLVPCQPS